MSYYDLTGAICDDGTVGDFDFDGPADSGAAPDPMYDSDDYYGHGRCTCGYQAAMADRQFDDDIRAEYFAGCSGCDPIMADCKPHGFGIENFEDPALTAANLYVQGRMDAVFGAYSLSFHGNGKTWNSFKPERDRFWVAISTHNEALELRSEKVWDALCNCCQTHREAVKRYTRWAKRATNPNRRGGLSAGPGVPVGESGNGMGGWDDGDSDQMRMRVA